MLTKDVINRKRYPTLCGPCAQKHKKTNKNFNSQYDWNAVYCDLTKTSNTLTEARQNNTPFYKGHCNVHGNVPLATLDQSCRQCSRSAAKRRRQENPKFNAPRVALASVRKRCKEKGIDYDLDLEFIRSIIPNRCPILGIELTYDDHIDKSPSIDRLDPNKGYVKGNVSIISNRANRLKNNGTAEEHKLIYEWMIKQQL